MMDNMAVNREKAICIIRDRTELRMTAYQEIISTFETAFERRTIGMIKYIKRLTNLLKDEIVVLNSYEIEFIEESDMKGYFDCEKIKSDLIEMMIKLNELI